MFGVEHVVVALLAELIGNQIADIQIGEYGHLTRVEKVFAVDGCADGVGEHHTWTLACVPGLAPHILGVNVAHLIVDPDAAPVAHLPQQEGTTEAVDLISEPVDNLALDRVVVADIQKAVAAGGVNQREAVRASRDLPVVRRLRVVGNAVDEEVVVVVNGIEQLATAVLLQFEILYLLLGRQFRVDLAGVLVEQVDIVFLAGETIGAVNELIVEDEDVVADEPGGFPVDGAFHTDAVKLAALTVDLGGIAGAGHIEEHTLLVGIPAHVLHLAVVVGRDAAQVEGSQGLLVVVIEHHNEFVVVGAERQAVECEPADADRFGDDEFQVFHFGHTWQILAAHVFAQTVDATVGLIVITYLLIAPSGAEAFFEH